MKRIILHWTGGTYKPNSTDIEHYHYVVDGSGEVFPGKYTVEDNENCNDGKYAHHTGNGNTGSIGIALCGMKDYIENRPNSTRYPVTAKQCEAFFRLTAKLIKKYNLLINSDTVMTHYEFNLRKKLKKKKIDIVYLPPFPTVPKNKTGDFIRNKVFWYFERL